MFRQKVVWSLLDLDYLKSHQHEPIGQLCIYMSKSHSAMKSKLAELDGKPIVHFKKITGKSKIGRRKDCDNLFFRSSWESNCYRILKLDDSIATLEYEPTTFSFAQFGILKGTVSYTPDFKVTYKDGSYIWIEIKGGLLKQVDKTKIRRFKKYFPTEAAKLIAVTPGPKSKTADFFRGEGIEIKWYYPELQKKYKNIIPHWE